ncbi:MAG TPA: zinc ribbon domain-containing protein [Phycisphaerales bacterium]|nr:zinc ribbon domain-containing protein [Phycisphaerales bacterium]
MRKWMIRIVMFTLIGAVVNVLVAFGSVLLEHVGGKSSGEGRVTLEVNSNDSSKVIWWCTCNFWDGRTATAVNNLQFHTAEGWGGISADSSALRVGPVDRGGALEWLKERGRFFAHETKATNGSWAFVGRGWPVPALWCEIHSATGTPVIYDGLEIGSASWRAWAEDRVLPLHPAWRGFAINTIVYGNVAMVVWMIAKIGQRIQRKKHGRCISCGYELRKSKVKHDCCPECGAEVKRKVER